MAVKESKNPMRGAELHVDKLHWQNETGEHNGCYVGMDGY